MNVEPTPASDRRSLMLNIGLFAVTSIGLLGYTWIFAGHIASGLSSSSEDELVWAAIFCSSLFYGNATYQAYTTYVRRNGASFSIGPYSILTSSLLPTANTGLATPNMVSLSSPTPSVAPRFNQLDSYLSGRSTPTPRGSIELAVCPPTPDSVASYSSSPMLVTPHMDRMYQPSNSPSPSRSSSNRDRQSKRNHKHNLVDVERLEEVYGLGMGDIDNRELVAVKA